MLETQRKPEHARDVLRGLIEGAATSNEGFSKITVNDLRKLLQESKLIPERIESIPSPTFQRIIFLTSDGVVHSLCFRLDMPTSYWHEIVVRSVNEPQESERRTVRNMISDTERSSLTVTPAISRVYDFEKDAWSPHSAYCAGLDALSGPVIKGGYALVGRNTPLHFSLDSDSYTLGRRRGDDSRLVINVENVSRDHAQLTRKENQWYIKDLGSRSGTDVNGVKITDERPLLPGQFVTVGSVIFTFESALLDPLVVDGSNDDTLAPKRGLGDEIRREIAERRDRREPFYVYLSETRIQSEKFLSYLPLAERQLAAQSAESPPSVNNLLDTMVDEFFLNSPDLNRAEFGIQPSTESARDKLLYLSARVGQITDIPSSMWVVRVKFMMVNNPGRIARWAGEINTPDEMHQKFLDWIARELL